MMWDAVGVLAVHPKGVIYHSPARIAGLSWDIGNRDKNLKHSVFNWECEQVFFNRPLVILEDPRHSLAENRRAAFGRADSGRQLVIIYTMRGQLLRVISARDMNRKERLFYEEATQD